jgi:hypothetical protein
MSAKVYIVIKVDYTQGTHTVDSVWSKWTPAMDRRDAMTKRIREQGYTYRMRVQIQEATLDALAVREVPEDAREA